MERKQFTFYRSYWDAIKGQPKKVQAEIVLAICAYALDEAEPGPLSPTARMAFSLCRPTLDTGRRRAQAGESGGKAEAKQTASKTEAKSKQNESKEEANPKQSPSEKEVEKEIEVEVENECYRERTAKAVPKKPRFVPPSVEEVRAYCQERRNLVDPQMFVDFYTGKGWMVGKSPMKDWRAAVRTWEKRDREKPAGPPRSSNPFLNLLLEEEGHEQS